MKKILSLLAIGILSMSLCANAETYNITPKTPKISESLKPIIVKYKKGDYIGSMVDLEELIKVEKNNTYAKYYLALCYTQLGYKEEATSLYKEVMEKNDNLALSYYSKKAITCLDNPNNAACSASPKNVQEETNNATDIETFIESGKKFHPYVMDKITKERVERKMIEEEFIKKQQDSINGEKKSHNQPTNEEIANALNILTKTGINPYAQFNPLSQNEIGINNPMLYALSNSDKDIAKMFLYNQMSQQGNILNYGI